MGSGEIQDAGAAGGKESGGNDRRQRGMRSELKQSGFEKEGGAELGEHRH